jgi:predicted metal-dependent hydrolase
MTAQVTAFGAPDIRVRRMDFRFDQSLPAQFVQGNPFVSAFMAALSTVFPDGERFFIDAVRHFRNDIRNTELQAAVRAFIGQEAHHGREHESFNTWLEEHGYPLSPAVQRVREGLEFARENMSARRQLAVTIALEHFTAIMAHQFLSHPETAESLHPDIRELFVWHAVEETEHKAVAYDVYQSVDGSYWRRVLVMLEVTLFFWLEMITTTRAYLKARGENSPGNWVRGLTFLLGRPGPLRRLLPDYLAWFKPGFHPWQQDNSRLVHAWRQAHGESGGDH